MHEPDQNPGPAPADIVAYLHPELDSVLLCREHGESWAGLLPLTAADLTGGGFCSWGADGDATVCGWAIFRKKPRR